MAVVPRQRQTRQDGHLPRGKQEGICKQFFADGTLYQEYNYVNGQPDGLVRVYDTDGKPYFEQEHKAGQIRKYRYFDKQGKVVGEASARGSKLRWVARFPSGVVRPGGRTGERQAGRQVRTFHESGYLASEATYRNDEQEGPEKDYYADGTVSSQQEYKKGKPEGLHRRFHKNGQVAAEGWLTDGNARANGAPTTPTASR
jgi:antitoxin component YwqK of YwqJK toxin-antitoxin module